MHQELKECIQGTAVLGIISCNLSCEFIGTKVAWKNCLQYNIPWNEHVTKCFLCSICCMKLACRIRFFFLQWLLQWKHCETRSFQVVSCLVMACLLRNFSCIVATKLIDVTVSSLDMSVGYFFSKILPVKQNCPIQCLKLGPAALESWGFWKQLL